jgi:hypothetical protein
VPAQHIALPPQGWTARIEDSLLHGCIPVIIMDNVQVGSCACWGLPLPQLLHAARASSQELPAPGAPPALLTSSVPAPRPAQAQFESVLDFSQFSVRIAQRDIPHIPQILLAVPQQRVVAMQEAISHVWQRLSYRWGPCVWCVCGRGAGAGGREASVCSHARHCPPAVHGCQDLGSNTAWRLSASMAMPAG